MAINDKNFQVIANTGSPVISKHPEADYWSDSWEIIRDSLVGEIAIKAKGTRYLRKMEAQSNDEYYAFLDRAYYYSMTSRTVNGLAGTIFRREPKIKNLPPQYNKAVKEITKSGTSLNSLIRDTANEILSVGRVGILLDMDANGNGSPFLVSYVAENILDWSVVEVRGRYVLKEVLLREIVEDRELGSEELRTSSLKYKAIYRKLILGDDGIYRQYIYRSNFLGGKLVTAKEPEIITPTRLGVPFDFIPFVFFGPYSNNPQVEKPPILDIALMNLSHYQSVAQLEHGRFYTALPIYYAHVSNSSDKGGDYVVGPNVVWEVVGDKSPGVIEFNGQGLMYLERALEEKESNISAMGGRMLGTKSTAVAESDNLVKVKEKNEMSLLLNVVTVLNEGFTKLLLWWLYWQNENIDELTTAVEMNKDFLFAQISAREFRAFTMMYQDGILPIDMIFDVLVKSDIVNDNITIDEFKSMLDNPEQFPNDPNYVARREGYPDAKAKLDMEEAERDRMAAQSQLKMTQAFTSQQNTINNASASRTSNVKQI